LTWNKNLNSEQLSNVVWADPQRQTACEKWLSELATTHGLMPESLRIASADASFRRYLRVNTTSGASLIVMDAPPDKENCEPFVKVAQLMKLAGLKAPEVLAWDAPQGFMLLTDLGDRTMMSAIDENNPQANHALYMQAVDALIAWQLSSKPGVLPPYDEALLQRELSLFPDWYLTKHRQLEVQGKMRSTLDSTFKMLVAHNLASPSVFVHRDFMPRNLMMPTGAEAALGVLDFQDQDFGAFYRAVEWMGLQRHLKVAGIFARLTLRDGKEKYLADAPRFIAYIRATAARYIELRPLLRLIEEVEGQDGVTGFAFGRM
jgi:aminoglycoside/choline kinase family phosphotransferase